MFKIRSSNFCLNAFPVVLALISGATTNCFGQNEALNHYQFLGTHNSYHLAPTAKVRGLIDMVSGGQGEALDYTNRPLREQLEVLGVRQIELDIYGDPEGGLYANPLVNRLPGQTPQSVDPAWKTPGFKIFHSPDFDQNTTVVTLKIALQQLMGWSKDHPDHEPVFVLLELETETYSAIKPPAFDGPALLALEKEIRDEMPFASILTPDDVRGDAPTLRDAVITKGWPTLEQTRGKFLFALDNEDQFRDNYLNLSPGKDLRGRLCFVSVPSDNPAAAWMKRNDPVGQFEEIQSLVKAGFVVRTRADADLKEIVANDKSRFNAALASGAQWISTDAVEPIHQQPGYEVGFPHHASWRLNPLFP